MNVHKNTIPGKIHYPAALILAGALLVDPAQAQPGNPPASEALQPAARGKVQANGIRIAYEEFGPKDREAVLLIMGNGTQLTAWPVELIEELVRRGYRVVA